MPLAGGRSNHAFCDLDLRRARLAALRDQYRQSHLDYLKVFDMQTLFAGPFTTDDESADLGSLRLIEFPDRIWMRRGCLWSRSRSTAMACTRTSISIAGALAG